MSDENDYVDEEDDDEEEEEEEEGGDKEHLNLEETSMVIIYNC